MHCGKDTKYINYNKQQIKIPRPLSKLWVKDVESNMLSSIIARTTKLGAWILGRETYELLPRSPLQAISENHPSENEHIKIRARGDKSYTNKFHILRIFNCISYPH